MKTHGLLGKLRSMRMIVVFLALLLSYGAISYSPQAATPNDLHSIDLGGVTGATNNTILAYGRYVLIAPFWTSAGISENGDIDPSQLDNDSVYMIDTKNPDASPIRKKLSSWDSKLGTTRTVFFPSNVVFDPNSNNLYVRGTRFEEWEGKVTPIDSFAYVKLILEDKGKAEFDSRVITIDIKGVGTSNGYTGEAPLDFAHSAKGDLMVFTNGAEVFSFTLAEGYLNRVEIVEPRYYNSSENTISFLDVDPVTNIVSVCHNQTWVGKDDSKILTSQLSFYRLGERGTFDLLKRTNLGLSQDGTALANGSNIVIVSGGNSQFALFATNDGSVCTVDLSSEGEQTTAKRLYTFPELAPSSPSELNPLLINYDSVTRTIGVVRPGFTAQISRPSNGRPSRISRPSNLHIASETSVLAMARLSKRNKVTSVNSFVREFNDEGGLSNFVSGEKAEWLISTYSGRLYSVGIGDDLVDSKLNLVGLIGSRVDRIDYYADCTSVVAISSCTLDPDGIRMVLPGSLVVGNLQNLDGQSRGAILQALLPTASTLGKLGPSIRRPSNIRR